MVYVLSHRTFNRSSAPPDCSGRTCGEDHPVPGVVSIRNKTQKVAPIGQDIDEWDDHARANCPKFGICNSFIYHPKRPANAVFGVADRLREPIFTQLS